MSRPIDHTRGQRFATPTAQEPSPPLRARFAAAGVERPDLLIIACSASASAVACGVLAVVHFWPAVTRALGL